MKRNWTFFDFRTFNRYSEEVDVYVIEWNIYDVKGEGQLKYMDEKVVDCQAILSKAFSSIFNLIRNLKKQKNWVRNCKPHTGELIKLYGLTLSQNKESV